jgi:lipopolysaccharide/colanic/teichoic acid biosynthesis glycosyltransferase
MQGTEQLVAGTALSALAPLFGVIALGIRLESKGFPFYLSHRTIRPGRYAYPAGGVMAHPEQRVLFPVFRTMRAEADKEVDVMEEDSLYDAGPFKKRENDPRVTRLGRLLRRTSVAELPLLWAVATGRMRLVGPWALPSYEAASIEEGAGGFRVPLTATARLRFGPTPGLAGLWQCSGRSSLSAEERALHDAYQAVIVQGTADLPEGWENERGVRAQLDLVFRTVFGALLQEGADRSTA